MCKISKMSKLISLVLAVCVLLCSAFSVTVFCAEVDYNLSTAFVDEFSYKSEASYNQEVYDYIKQEMLNCTEYIYLDKFNIELSDAKQVFLDVVFYNPELFHVKTSSFAYGSDYSGRYLSILAPKYVYTGEEYKNNKAKFQDAANELLSKIDPVWDDETKALILHDELILNCAYSSDEALNNDVPEIYTAYGALVNGDAVCQGYTLAYNYLLKQVGIDAVTVISDAMNHSWSLVNIDGEYYHVDTTWDDPTPDRLGRVNHNHFLLSDAEIANADHYYWDTDIVADSTKYDDYFWQSINTGISYVNNCYYHIHNLAGHENFGCLAEYDHGKCNVVYDIDQRWYVDENSGAYWVDDFSYLNYANNRFYFDTPNAIYSVNVNGTDLKLVYELNAEQKALGDIYGMKITDGKVYASMAKSPNEPAQIIYLTDIVADEPAPTEPTTATTEPVTVSSKPRTIGDIDNDNLISIKDATVIQSIIARLANVSEEEKSFADVNGDGYLSITDATIIQMRCAKMNYI